MWNLFFHPVHKGQLHTTSTTHQSRVPLKKKPASISGTWKQQRMRARSFSAQALGFTTWSTSKWAMNLPPICQRWSIHCVKAALRRMSFAFSICACFMSFILPTKTDRDKLKKTRYWVRAPGSVDSLCRNAIQGRFRKSTNWTVSIDLFSLPGHSLTRTHNYRNQNVTTCL